MRKKIQRPLALLLFGGLSLALDSNVLAAGNGPASLNSTSANGVPGQPVVQQPLRGNALYRIFATNDLGMHCGDFDTRISSILPPFNILHAQVIRRGGSPDILSPADGIGVVYSAASNPTDPVLTGINSSGDGPVLSSRLPGGSVFKTNFWDIAPGSTEPTALSAYRAFYPPGILDSFYPNQAANAQDLGLPAPNTERLYLGDGTLTAEQQTTPGRQAPYTNNSPQTFKLFTTNQPFFIKFPFGYTASGVNWFEAAGVPLTAFDDHGRENPWPLLRVQAKDSGGSVLASVDTVVPISGEANCSGCHTDPADGGNGAATRNLSNVASILDDPQLDAVPLAVSKEYAGDLNLVRLHDQKHGTHLETSGPVVCQSCHYTPALDLAQVGPKGPADADGNGRQQTNVKTMSNVMHSHHADVTDTNGNKLFPIMPPAVDANGNPRDPVAARNILQQTCYQCHPGRRTDCLRGAMASGGMLCQDCHGQMSQVGNDFSKNVSPANPGAFQLASDFYSNPITPRVPWANEPGCGSCHTGDAMDNLQAATDTLGAPNDLIRLTQAFRIGDTKATPIVPSNKRFAENTVAATGNPMLYRVSKGHKGVFCEACHGATHGIWPNKNPAANDNVASVQLQGHSGVVIECDSCHTGDLGITLDGPHGMHPVGSAGNNFANGGHENLAESNPDACRACHGRNGEGTVLSAMHQDRQLNTDDNGVQLFAKGHQVTCFDCHENKLGAGGGEGGEGEGEGGEGDGGDNDGNGDSGGENDGNGNNGAGNDANGGVVRTETATLIAPNGSSGDTTPTYTWVAVNGAFSYYLWVRDTSGDAVKIHYTAADAGCANGLGRCAVTPTTEVKGPSRWWIQAESSLGTSQWSRAKAFTVTGNKPVGAAPSTPSGSIPGTLPTYRWAAVSNSDWYYLWVEDSRGVRVKQWYSASELGCIDGTSSCSVTPETEIKGRSKWWVQTWNGFGAGPWSKETTFSEPGGVPTTANLLSPNSVTGIDATYRWAANPRASWYYLWVEDGNSNVFKKWYSSVDAGCADGTTTCSVTPNTPIRGPSQWWIQTWNGYGYGPWSAATGFTAQLP